MTPQDTLVSCCELLNFVLEDKTHPVKIELRGMSLNLRAKLPSKEGGGKPSMQRISLGLKADKLGLKIALQTALKIQEQLKTDSFQWRDYDSNFHSKESIEKSLEQFKSNFFNDPKKKLKLNANHSTWKGAYLPYVKRLKKIQKEHQLPLGSELFLLVLESYDACSAARKKCFTVLKQLAKQEKILLPENFSELSSGYQSLQTGKLKYPSDQEIIKLREKIPNPKWRWVFSMIATYGLRTHEIFFCDAEDLLSKSNKHNAIRIGSETKTGERLVYPLRPEWVEQFELKDIQKPSIKLDPERSMKDISNNVARVFREHNLGFIPYALRHAWAIRSIHHGLNPSIASKMMGHSVQMHTKNYHYYLNEKDMDKAYVDAIG